MSPYKKAVRIVLVDGCVILLLMAALEVVLRIWAPQYGQMLFDHEYTGAAPIAMNEEGYRGPVVPAPRPDDSRLLLALGDSVTFGTGVRHDAVWPEVAADLLSLHEGLTAYAISYGVPGVSLQRLRTEYEERWNDLSPDALLLLATPQIVGRTYFERDSKPSARPATSADPPAGLVAEAKRSVNRFVHRFCLPSFISHSSQTVLYAAGLGRHEANPRVPFGVHLAYGVQQGDLPEQMYEEAWSVFSRELQQMAETAARNGARFVVGFAPPRFTLSDSLSDNIKLFPVDRITIDAPDRVRAICADLGIEYAEVPSLLRTANGGPTRTELFIPFDYTHLSPEGHRIVAQSFVGMLTGSVGRKPTEGADRFNAGADRPPDAASEPAPDRRPDAATSAGV